MSQEWKLVPVVPTEEMVTALANAPLYQEWSAMLAAIPSPPECNEPVAMVNDSDDGLFVEILYGDDGSPLKLGDKLYTYPVDGAVTRLHAENAALQQRLNEADQRADDLQSELTKARELLMKTRSVLNSQFWDKWDSLVEVRLGVSDFLAYQSAPAAKGEEYPSAEIAAEAAAGVYDIDFAGPDEEPDANNIPKYIVNGRETDVHPTCPVRGCGKPSCSPWTTCLEHHR